MGELCKVEVWKFEGGLCFLRYAPCIVYFVSFMGLVVLFPGVRKLYFVSVLSSVGFFCYFLSKLCISAPRFWTLVMYIFGPLLPSLFLTCRLVGLVACLDQWL